MNVFYCIPNQSNRNLEGRNAWKTFWTEVSGSIGQVLCFTPKNRLSQNFSTSKRKIVFIPSFS